MMKKFKNMKKTLMILMAVALVALPTMAQQNWKNQQSLYGRPYQPQRTVAPTATYHSSNFHSTSTMMHSGSNYSANPTLNRNGSPVYRGTPYKSPSAPKPVRRARQGGLIDWGDGSDVSDHSGDDPGYMDPSYDPSEGSGDDYSGDVFDPDPNDEDGAPNGWGTPIGDAVLPLLLMSLAFCGYVYFRRKRSEA